jgi:hypothetical protein
MKKQDEIITISDSENEKEIRNDDTNDTIIISDSDSDKRIEERMEDN